MQLEHKASNGLCVSKVPVDFDRLLQETAKRTKLIFYQSNMMIATNVVFAAKANAAYFCKNFVKSIV